MSGAALAHLVHGDDAGLVSQALSSLLERLGAEGVGLVEEYSPGGRDEPIPLGAVLDACRTPPFFADRRVVVVRDAQAAHALDAAGVKQLVDYLADPLETTSLVVVYAGKKAPAALVKAVAARGEVTDAAPSGRAQRQWLDDKLAAAPVRLDRNAAELLRDHLGEDLARLEGILSTLEAAFGTGHTVRRDDLAPYLGEAGPRAPWDLTDAIDAGDIDRALEVLHRLLNGGERHPFQVMATLSRHYSAILALDGAEVADEAAASALSGLSAYPAKKALTQSRRLGHDRITRAVVLLADADVDLRGRVGLDEAVVMEVLVARLAQLGRVHARRA